MTKMMIGGVLAAIGIVALDEGAAGLVRHDGTGEAHEAERKRQAEQKSEDRDQNDRGTKMLDHYAAPIADRMRSMSLMPTKGATRPPSP